MEEIHICLISQLNIFSAKSYLTLAKLVGVR